MEVRHAMFKYSLSVVVCMIVGCTRPTPSQPQQSRSQEGPQPAYVQGGSTPNPNWWLCTAEGSVGTASGDGPWSWSTERADGNGANRDEAQTLALEDCNSMMILSAKLPMTIYEKREARRCRVTDCVGPGHSRVTKRSF
jgi:hypothetical protein